MLTPESSSSCGQQNYNAFNSTDSQNKSNNNIVETMIPPIVPRRHLPPEPKPRNLDTKSNLRLSSITDDQNNFPTEIDKNFPDLLEINSNTSQDIRLLSLQQALAGRQRNEDSFYTLPRKINVKYNHNTKQHRDSDSQSPLLTDSRYGSSGGESSVGSISNRRLSIESYSNFTNSNGNTKSQRSNSFLNLAPSAINRNGPSLPGSPSSATPLLELRGLPRGELTRTPAVPSTPSMPLSYDYHAAQLERFLEEYRSLQEQLCRMKETCESISENRSTSTSRFADAMLFSKCVATPSSGDESNFGKKKPSVSVTAASGAMSAGNLDANNSLSIHGNDVSSISSWMNTNNSSQMKRMGGNTDFYRS